MRILLAVGVALLIPFPAFAQNNGAEQADRPQVSQVAPNQVASDPYSDLNKQVQEKLRAHGFYAGPVNGEFGFNTQAALTQFQLSIPMPASGMLDDQTLAALGIEQVAQASAGASADASAPAMPSQPADGGSVEVGAKSVIEN